MIQKLDPRNEPISVSTLVTVLVWVGGYFGLGWDDQTATAIATVAFVVGQYAARSLSVPVKKHEKAVEDVKETARQG